VATAKPDMSGLAVPLLASPVESVNPAPNQAEQWGQFPVQQTPAAKLGKDDDLAKDQEGIYIERAEESLKRGTCPRNLIVSLDEVAADPNRGPRAEKARILRARCFDTLMQMRQAEQEYRRYVSEYPTGTFLDEARAMIGNK
jgi:hypothetical protein